MARTPMHVASVIFGDLGQDWIGGANHFDLSQVDFWRIHAGRIGSDASLRPTLTDIDRLHQFCDREGFEVVAVTPVGFSFAGSAEQFQRVFSTDDQQSNFDPERTGGRPYVETPSRICRMGGWRDPAFDRASGLEIGTGAVPLSDSWAATHAVGGPHGRGPWLHGACLLPDHEWSFGARPTRVEDLQSTLGIRPDCGGQGRDVTVAIVDSGAVGFAGVDTDAFAGLDPNLDERGHGTAVLAHLRAVAPDVRVVLHKYVDNSGVRNYPVAAFQRAVQFDPCGRLQPAELPKILLCSWAMLDLSVALQREIADATRRGVLVVFASGNGSMTDVAPGEAGEVFTVERDKLGGPLTERLSRAAVRSVHTVAHPDALSVGGVVARCSEMEPIPSPVASAYDSAVFSGSTNLQLPPRHAPDLCGLVALPVPPDVSPIQGPALTETPTAPDSTVDRKPDGAGDGRVRTSGTSMAAAHVAGVAARLIEQHPQLTPRALRNVLMTTARGPLWDPQTGFGLVRWDPWSRDPEEPAATNWLVEGPCPYIRAALTDPGTIVPRYVSLDPTEHRCPDIILRHQAFDDDATMQLRLGLPAKHCDDLDLLQRDQPHHVFVRLTNRGLVPFGGEVVLYGVVEFEGAYRLERLCGVRLDQCERRLDPGDFEVVHLGEIEAFPAALLAVVGPVPEHPIFPCDTFDARLLIHLVQCHINTGLRWLRGDS